MLSLILKALAGIAASSTSQRDSSVSGVINYGDQKKDGGHDPRGNKGADRTPAQRRGDAARRGPRNKP